MGGVTVTTALEVLALRRRPAEIARRVVGFVLAFVLRAYGAAAALSAALSDAEGVGGKAYDAVHAVPNLRQRYEQAAYVLEHRQQIQSTLDYVNANAPDAAQLETAARDSSETLGRLTTTYSEVNRAWDAFTGIRPTNVLQRLPESKDHLQAAWAQKPELDSLQSLTDKAEAVGPFLRQLGALDIDFSKAYGELLSVLDNFASDEVVGTVTVMALALGVTWLLGLAVGFWARRGRPGIVVAALQRLGARVFPTWYVSNLEYALGRPVYEVARQRVQRDLVADPQRTLDAEALRELEQWFEKRRAERSS